MLDYLEELILGDQPEEIIHIQGNFSFFLEPVIQGTLPNHNCSVTVVCYSSMDRQNPIDFEVKWCKILNGEAYEMKDYKEIYYHMNPADIDLKIKAVVSSKNPKYPGSAYIYIGPIVLDGSLKPEIEGMVINKTASFKVTVISYNDTALKPNSSTIRVEKPYFYLTYDPEMVSREVEQKNFEPIMVDFEMDPEVKIKIDPRSINNIIVQYKSESGSEVSLKIKFDSRMQRDIFYIYHKLMRILKNSIVEEVLREYEKLFYFNWSFLKKSIGGENREYNVDYELIYNFDKIREHLKAMVRFNKELNEDNTALLDSLDILEADLAMSVKEFRSLIEDQKSKKKLTRKDVSRYEKSSQSIIAESSVIIDGIKQKGKKKKELDNSRLVNIRDIEDDIKSIKQVNDVYKKEIEILKGLSKPTPVVGSVLNQMDSVNLSVIQVAY